MSQTAYAIHLRLPSRLADAAICSYDGQLQALTVGMLVHTYHENVSAASSKNNVSFIVPIFNLQVPVSI
jgi:hypothetical protein